MGRERIYSSAAERQKAYRDRARPPLPAPAPPPKKIRQPSRPKKLAEIDEKVQFLLESYQEWLNNLPESLENTSQADKLADTVEKLEAVADLLAEIDPPLGYGRD
jgi:hypothetical protein